MKLRLKHKIAAIAILASLLPVLVIVLLSLSQRKKASILINDTMQEIITDELNIIVSDFYSLCKTANDFTQQYVNHSLNIARERLYRESMVKLLSEKVSWTVVNQFSREESIVWLPKMIIQNQWPGQNKDFNKYTAVVDDVSKLLGATCTIFQRMNEHGDMLRIATNVETLDNQRAIGTYIPAINPGGQQNPVIAAVMNGNTFRGRAYVVNDWYLTAYEAIRDSGGKIIGMLYVGVKQESAESFRESILQTAVGKTGYLYAFGAKGQQKGRYAISKGGLRDGEFILDQKDINGDYFVQDILVKALNLHEGEMDSKIYTLSENGVERKLVTLFTYFEPWDWIIGANAFEDDFQEAKENADAVIAQLIRQVLFWGVIILMGALFLAFYLSARLSKPLIQIAGHAQVLAGGDISHSIDYDKDDEIGLLAKSYNKMAADIQEQREQLRQSNHQLMEINATKDKFFSIIAHDLKNPFNTLLTSSAALVGMFDKLDKEKLKKGIETLNQSAVRGYDLLVDLLTWARSQSDKIEYNMERINLVEVALQNVELLRERAAEKQVDLQCNLNKDSMVWSDKNMVSTIIRNLLTNAVKFTSKGGKVSISCAAQKNFCQIIVEDNGVGISSDNKKKLFRLDSFYRTLGTDKEKGTGLGLILCKEFIDKLGGSIWVESEVGKGSRFIFTLPFSE